MRFEFELLVAPGFVNDDFAHEVLGRPPNRAEEIDFSACNPETTIEREAWPPALVR